ncbi:hypothetical protein [Streptomyces triculaminicus]
MSWASTLADGFVPAAGLGLIQSAQLGQHLELVVARNRGPELLV